MVVINTLVRRCLKVILAASVMLVADPVGVAVADEPAPNNQPVPGTVSVFGDVRNPTAFTLDAIRDLPTQTEAVTYATQSGPQSHSYTGCPLDAVISATDPEVDAAAKHPSLTIAILATGADGYSVAWAEVSPTSTPKPALVAYIEDDEPLDQPRLVVPGDLDGARYVNDLIELNVVNLARR
jgi:hypothetical protein